MLEEGLPRWFNDKESTCQCRRRWFDSWVGKIPWQRKWQPTLGYFPGESRTEEPDGLQSTGLQRAGQDWATENAHTYLNGMNWVDFATFPFYEASCSKYFWNFKKQVTSVLRPFFPFIDRVVCPLFIVVDLCNIFACYWFVHTSWFLLSQFYILYVFKIFSLIYSILIITFLVNDY